MSVEPELLRALVAEAARRSQVCWVSYRHPRAAVADRLVWHAWHDDAVLVLVDPVDQPLAGAASLTEQDLVEVAMRSKESGGRLLTWRCRPEVVPPSDERWEEYAGALLGVRLNLPDPEATRQRWREQGRILRLAPDATTADPQAGALP